MLARAIVDTAKHVVVEIKEFRKATMRQIKLPHYRGSAFECPLCKTNLRTFKPIWKSYRRKMEEYGADYPFHRLETFNPDAYNCPCCEAADRERLYFLYLQEQIAAWPLGQRFNLIDFAPARPLEHRLRAFPGISYRTADLFRADVDDRVDLSDMAGYDDGCCDAFICSHVLEHVPDDRKAMRELARILSPQGFGIVMVPLITGVEDTHEDPAIVAGAARWKAYGQDDHLRQYGRRDFVERLQQAGLQVKSLGKDYFGDEPLHRAGISDGSVLYVVQRS